MSMVNEGDNDDVVEGEDNEDDKGSGEFDRREGASKVLMLLLEKIGELIIICWLLVMMMGGQTGLFSSCFRRCSVQLHISFIWNSSSSVICGNNRPKKIFYKCLL